MLFEMLSGFCMYIAHNRIKHSKFYLYNFILQFLSKYLQTLFFSKKSTWDLGGVGESEIEREID